MIRADASHARSRRYVVVGAGVVGAMAAYRLAQTGAEVTLVEGGNIGGGTSGASFAHINASYSGYWDYFELRRAGLEGYAGLRQEFEGASWWHETGFVKVHRTGGFDGQDEHLARLQGINYPAIQVEDKPCTIESALADFEAARTYSFPGEGWVDLPRMVADLVERFRRLGGVVRTADPVTAVLSSGGEVTGVRVQSGATLEGDEVVVCCGRWTDQLLGLAGLETRCVALDSAAGTPVPGLLVVTDSRPDSVSRVIAVDDIAFRPEGDGHTMVWSGMIDGELQRLGGTEAESDVVDRLAAELLDAASDHVPAIAGASVQRAMVTMRAMPADGLPVVGRPPGIDGLYVVLAHAAATLAPVLGDLVVTEVAHQSLDARLDRFRPGRLMPAHAPSQNV